MARQAEVDTATLERGALLYDSALSEVGEYRGVAGPYVMLRPVGVAVSGRRTLGRFVWRPLLSG